LTNVPVDEFPLPLPAKNEGGVMSTTTENEKEPNKHTSQTRTESRVVVAGALPLGKPILQKVIVTLTTGSAEDVGDGVQASSPFMGFLDSRGNFALGGSLVDMDALLGGFGFALVLGAVGDEGSLDLVGVEKSGFLAVGLVQFVLVGIGTHTEEVYQERRE
jgi:hypothetical protein